jgi:peptidoglycan/LPS O-acetylase OafA/YrhL
MAPVPLSASATAGSAGAATPLGPERIVELDGLRGLAALAVVVAHYFGEPPDGLEIFTVGWIGVDVFFVLSGFLIGSIILSQCRQPNFFLKFYARRALRILPVYFVTVAAVFAAIALLGARPWIDAPLPLAAYLTFTQNVAMPLYGAAGGPWLLPTWTLAVEEQFYLLSPVLLYLVPPHRLVPLLLACIAAAFAFRLSSIFWDDTGLAALTLLPGRLDLLLCGVLAAHVAQSSSLRRPRADDLVRAVPLLCAMALLLLLLVQPLISIDMLKLFGPTLIGIGTASFILAIVRGAPEGARFRSATLRFFGTISYALYLFHQPVAGLMHGLILDASPDIGSIPELAVTFCAFAVSVGLAWLSWRLMEGPLLRLGRRLRYSEVGRIRPRPTAASAVV